VNDYPVGEAPHFPSQIESAEAFEEPDSTEPLPIASSGDLKMMPPSTGLPMARGAVNEESESALTPLLDAIPEAGPAAVDHADFAGHTIHAPGTINTEGSQAENHG
jgi:sec-independent protein translocase protein TatB